MQEASDDGVPPVRSLLLEYPNDSTARKIKDQFMLGPDLLMAPIVSKGSVERHVYLPEG
jgi:alpha-D-xyloside xylohydrolase